MAKVITTKAITCAWCGRENKVTVTKETITKPEPGEYEISMTVEKADQTKLE